MARTHEMIFFDKKPADIIIEKMIVDYFDSEAESYDGFNSNTKKRKLFLESIDSLIASDIKRRSDIQKVLSIASGTGAREQNIFNFPNNAISLLCLDASKEMCNLARQKGFEVIEADWLKAELNGKTFDATLFLYSLGLIPSRSQRVKALKKIAKHLKKGGMLYFDVMNLNDQKEWGPEIKQQFENKRLDESGYELGDVFYRRIGAAEVSFFHYFTIQEIVTLLDEAGFLCLERLFIDSTTEYGKIVGQDEGAILIFAQRK